MRNKVLPVVSLAAALTLAGCASSTASAGSATQEAEMPSEITVITSVDENNPDAGALNDQFAQDMSEALGLTVHVMESADYTAIVEGMSAKTIDATMVSPMSYYQVAAKTDVEMVAMAKMAYEYYSVFITQADNDEINSLEDLKGKTFAFVDQASSSGYLYPKAYLVDQLNLDPDQLETSGYFFSSVAFSGNHQTSLIGVSMGDYDAACVAAPVLNMMAAGGQFDSASVKIIDQTEDIPSPCYIVRADLPQELKDGIRDFLLNYDNEEFFAAALGDSSMRFTEADPSAYESTKKVLEMTGVDLSGNS